jgi:preprotein translocase subunit SecE
MGLKQYIQETRAEMHHVTWPTKKQAIQYTIAVIIVSLLVSAYLGVFDSIFVALIKYLVPSLGY